MHTPLHCQVGPYRIAYERQGSGAPVVLLHGITTYRFLWWPLIPTLSQYYDVIALDLLGCGDSDKPLEVSYALREHATRLKEFLDSLGVSRCHLVGHDLGGGIAQIFAVRHPEMLHSLSLLNTVGYDFWPVQPITAMRTPIIRQLAMASLDIGMLRLIVHRGMHHKDRLTEDLMERFQYPLRTSEGRRAFLHFARCLDNRDLTGVLPQLRRLPTPALILRGEKDIYLSAAIAEKLHTDLPNSRLIRVPDAGHFIQFDAPETCVTHLLGFFKEVTHD
ncbi:MAG: alpha/beta hydrolase [Anaerolineae bacterium]|nr:MAG: alpha/beta hydrolase [Anaerolineae bacterium]